MRKYRIKKGQFYETYINNKKGKKLIELTDSPITYNHVPPLRTSDHKISMSEKAMGFIENSRAQNTKISYTSDWKDFVRWTRFHNVDALPASPETVGNYLTHLAAECHFKASTMQRKLSSISQAHKMRGYDSPTAHSWVRSIWKGILRDPNTVVAQQGKRPALIEDIRAMNEALTKMGGLKSLRDRVILLFGFAGAFRRSELVALNVEDIEETREGLVVLLRKSKTDQDGKGRKIAIPYGTHFETCPVRTYKEWLQESNITEGPIFRRMRKGDHLYRGRLSDKGIARVVKEAAERAGLDPSQYAGHSLRAGFATTAARAGASERAIMEQTGHKSLMVVRRYIREGNLFRDNAATYVGL